MAEEPENDNKDPKDQNGATSGRQPIAPHVRRRLQQAFEAGSKNAAASSYDYAADLFTQCVIGDPSNLTYLQAFLTNISKKYNNNKKGSKLASLSGMGAKGKIKMASTKKDWPGVIKAGLEMLKLNPWDVGTLSAMAAAYENMGDDQCELACLKQALDANPKDTDVNKLCAQTLGRQGQYDQAIACWRRVQANKKYEEEANRAIAGLSVEKTISRSGIEMGSSGTSADEADASAAEASKALTPEQRLEKAIAADPAEMKHYVELAEMHGRNERHSESVQVMVKALEASGGDIKVREALEDAQLRGARHQLLIAEQQARKERTEKTKQLYMKVKAEVNQLEIEVFQARADRYPTNISVKYELGLRLKRGGRFEDAIKVFQAARNDPKRKGLVLIELGECFTRIKHWGLAQSSLADALEVIPPRDEELRKTALYLAGQIAEHVKDLENAQKYYQELASLDFGYKDVAERLDRIRRMRDNE